MATERRRHLFLLSKREMLCRCRPTGRRCWIEEHIVCFQEHGLRKTGLGGFKAETAQYGWEVVLGPTDPDHRRPSAGVGIATRIPMATVQLIPKTKDHDHVVKAGRLNASENGIFAKRMTTAIIYGWTGGQKDNAATERTDDLCRILPAELKQHRDGPVMTNGNVNV